MFSVFLFSLIQLTCAILQKLSKSIYMNMGQVDSTCGSHQLKKSWVFNDSFHSFISFVIITMRTNWKIFILCSSSFYMLSFQGCAPYSYAGCNHTGYYDLTGSAQKMKSCQVPFDLECPTECTNKHYKTPLDTRC